MERKSWNKNGNGNEPEGNPTAAVTTTAAVAPAVNTFDELMHPTNLPLYTRVKDVTKVGKN